MIISGSRHLDKVEIGDRIDRAATGLRALGLRDGAPIAMMLRNDFALFEVSVAAAGLGKPVVPINWHLKSDEVSFILKDSGADLLVCHADLLRQIEDGLPDEIQILIVRTPPEIAAAFGVPPHLAEVPGGMRDWDQWRDGHPSSPQEAIGSSPMFYTSGTTGQPKGVRRKPARPDQLAASARVGAIAYGIEPEKDQVVLMNGPTFRA